MWNETETGMIFRFKNDFRATIEYIEDLEVYTMAIHTWDEHGAIHSAIDTNDLPSYGQYSNLKGAKTAASRILNQIA